MSYLVASLSPRPLLCVPAVAAAGRRDGRRGSAPPSCSASTGRCHCRSRWGRSRDGPAPGTRPGLPTPACPARPPPPPTPGRPRTRYHLTAQVVYISFGTSNMFLLTFNGFQSVRVLNWGLGVKPVLGFPILVSNGGPSFKLGF